MHASILKRLRPGIVPPELQVQLPLVHPDYRRRSRIKPRPLPSPIYFAEEHAWPVTIRHATVKEVQPAVSCA